MIILFIPFLIARFTKFLCHSKGDRSAFKTGGAFIFSSFDLISENNSDTGVFFDTSIWSAAAYALHPTASSLMNLVGGGRRASSCHLIELIGSTWLSFRRSNPKRSSFLLPRIHRRSCSAGIHLSCTALEEEEKSIEDTARFVFMWSSKFLLDFCTSTKTLYQGISFLLESIIYIFWSGIVSPTCHVSNLTLRSLMARLVFAYGRFKWKLFLHKLMFGSEYDWSRGR